MNMKQIRNYFKSALAILLATLVLAVATGLSYTAHYCHNHLAGVAFYTELGIQKPASCGCKEDSTINKAQAFADTHVTLKKNGCCSNISFFGKLNIESPVNYFSSIAFILPAFDAVHFDINNQATSENAHFSDYDMDYPPPLLAGRKLVLFLSQQRIPLINYNS